MVVTLTHTTSLNIVTDQVHPPMTTSVTFQQDKAPCHTEIVVQEWFEEHDKDQSVESWCYIPQGTFRGLVETETQWIRPTQYSAGGFDCYQKGTYQVSALCFVIFFSGS